MFSPDGRTLVFESWASDLINNDFNQAGDVFAIRIASSNPAPVFAGQIIFAPASRQPPTLTWPTEIGKSYRVEFKDDLRDADWQPLNGNVWTVGDRGYATDLAASSVQRFYRVVAF